MTDFTRIVSFPAIAKCDGQERMLTAKVVRDRIVFAGGEFGQSSIPDTSPLDMINRYWVAYCAQNHVSGQANPDRIDQGDLDRARGAF